MPPTNGPITKTLNSIEVTSRAPTGRKTRIIVLLWIVNFAAVFLFCIGAEFAARRIDYARLHTTGHTPRTLRDPWAAWWNNPAFSRLDIHHDAQGFRRDTDVTLEKPSNTIRIFFLGGSAAYGCEGLYPEIEPRYTRLYNNQTIDHYLERKLNATFGSKHWEVINAAVNEYRLHQDLAELLSRLLQYHPDYVILMDGQNDVSALTAAGPHYDPYSHTPHLDEFNELANPQSFASLGAAGSAWLQNNSVIFRIMEEHLRLRLAGARRETTARKQIVHSPVQFSDLTADEKNRYQEGARQLETYHQTVLQIQSIAELQGIKAIFALQPELILSHKLLTDSEKRLAEYHRNVSGNYVTYAYEQYEPEIERRLEADKRLSFLSLLDVFDESKGQMFTDYCHLTPAGNSRVADQIFEFAEAFFRESAR